MTNRQEKDGRVNGSYKNEGEVVEMKLWAHRGCSLRYPENTLTSFEKAAELFEKGLAGIELDIQMTRDGQIVVIHDERIDRTTDGFGFVRDYSLAELKTFHIHTGEEKPEYIPAIDEVLDLLEEKLKLLQLLTTISRTLKFIA